jgi:hypothetical protein
VLQQGILVEFAENAALPGKIHSFIWFSPASSLLRCRFRSSFGFRSFFGRKGASVIACSLPVPTNEQIETVRRNGRRVAAQSALSLGNAHTATVVGITGHFVHESTLARCSLGKLWPGITERKPLAPDNLTEREPKSPMIASPGPRYQVRSSFLAAPGWLRQRRYRAMHQRQPRLNGGS